MTHMQYEKTQTQRNLRTVKWVQCDKNPIQRTVRIAHLSVLMTVHNFGGQYDTEHF